MGRSSRRSEVPHHAPQPRRRLPRGREPRRGRSREAVHGRPRLGRFGALRHDARHQRSDRAEGAADRRARHRGLRERSAALARPRLRRGSAATSAGRSGSRDASRSVGAELARGWHPGAHRLPRRGDHPDEARGRADEDPAARRQRRRGVRGLARELRRQRVARGEGRGNHPRRVSVEPVRLVPGDPLAPHLEAEVRVRTHDGGRGLRLPSRAHVLFPRHARGRAPRARVHEARAAHPQHRRHGVARVDARPADDPLGPGRRPRSLAAPDARVRHPAHRRDRHGRHVVRHRHHRARRDLDLRLPPGRRPLARVDADGVSADARRRRRLDRALRSAVEDRRGRARLGGIRSGSGVLRPRRQPADGVGRRPRARLSRSRVLRGRHAVARSGARRARDRGARRGAARRLRARGGEAHQAEGRRQHGGRYLQGSRHARLRREKPEAPLLRWRRAGALLRLSRGRSRRRAC